MVHGCVFEQWTHYNGADFRGGHLEDATDLVTAVHEAARSRHGRGGGGKSQSHSLLSTPGGAPASPLQAAHASAAPTPPAALNTAALFSVSEEAGNPVTPPPHQQPPHQQPPHQQPAHQPPPPPLQSQFPPKMLKKDTILTIPSGRQARSSLEAETSIDGGDGTVGGPLSPREGEGVFEDGKAGIPYDPVYYKEHPDDWAYDITVDMRAPDATLGIVIAPTIEMHDQATVIKRFSTTKLGKPGLVEQQGVRIYDIVTHIDGKDITEMDHDATVKTMRKVMATRTRDGKKVKPPPFTLTIFPRARVMETICDQMWAFFGKPRPGTAQSVATPSKIKHLAWVDRYIVTNEILQMPLEERKKRMRKYIQLWHPDRLMRSLERKLFDDSYRADIKEKSTWVAGELGSAKLMVQQVEEAAAQKFKAGDVQQSTGASAFSKEQEKGKDIIEEREVWSGWLTKLALKSAANWRKRWFSLNNKGRLTYAGKKDAKKVKGTLQLTGSSKLEVGQPGVKHRNKLHWFTIEYKDDEASAESGKVQLATLTVAAADEQTRTKWVNLLEKTIEGSLAEIPG